MSAATETTAELEARLAAAQAASDRFDALCPFGHEELAFLVGYLESAAPELAMEAMDALEQKRAKDALAAEDGPGPDRLEAEFEAERRGIEDGDRP